jgi:hypothetical protein
MVLRESNFESFLWQVAPDLPLELTLCLDALRQAGGEFPSRTAAALVLQQAVGAGRSTAFTRLNDLLNRCLMTECDEVLRVKEIVEEARKP